MQTLATKAGLKAEKDKIIKLQEFNSSYFRDKSHLTIMVLKLFNISTNV